MTDCWKLSDLRLRSLSSDDNKETTPHLWSYVPGTILGMLYTLCLTHANITKLSVNNYFMVEKTEGHRG